MSLKTPYGGEMSAQPSLFPAIAKSVTPSTVVENGPSRKRRGMAKAAAHHSEALEAAQAIARFLGRRLLSVTIEDVRRKFSEFHAVPWDLSNASGSVFAGPEWEAVGYRKAERPEAHCRILRVWRLKK